MTLTRALAVTTFTLPLVLGAGRVHGGIHPYAVQATGAAAASSPLRGEGAQLGGRGVGGFAGGEFAFGPDNEVVPRLYSGVLLTFPERTCGERVSPCDITAKALVAGAKLRFQKSFILFAPFFEAGIGGSLGAITTRSGNAVDESKILTYHVPIGVGLALGPHLEHDFAFRLLVHPGAKQYAVTFGFGFGLAF